MSIFAVVEVTTSLLVKGAEVDFRQPTRISLKKIYLLDEVILENYLTHLDATFSIKGVSHYCIWLRGKESQLVIVIYPLLSFTHNYPEYYEPH